MRDTNHPTAGKFRPVSFEDFSRYAKALAWQIEEPLQRTQELLAQIYGYSDLHELKRTLATPGDPGPFDEKYICYDEGAELADRNNHVLFSVARYKRIPTLQCLTLRWGDARDIGLFDRPDKHRRAFLKIRLKHEILKALDTNSAAEARGHHEYATVGTTLSDENEYVLHFTDIGRAVFDAVTYIVDRHQWQPIERSYDAETVIRKLNAITRLHPNNPWSLAAKVCFAAEYYETMDSDTATQLFEDAKRAIEIFEVLYAGLEKKAASHNLVVLDAETYLWPAVLYWGGVVALEYEKLRFAKRWLKLNMRLCPDDNFGARFLLQDL